ncbi:maleylpyruvate isomerase family mycothiol-dependent enzyme [Kitasatospora sp. NPDC052896]|uniref:maleylpyruvate isomerase family mycothiol-dependent enzyme n=1 Tax=Kitasatospora sp. NPDC052896 TaxID=3364061 RepID=UPI0037CC65B7
MTPPPDVPALLAHVARSGDRLTAALDRLTDPDVRAPSTLPGWTRGHVITHVAGAVDAYVWLLGLARTGEAPGPRGDAASLAEAVERGSARSAGELAGDLRGRLARLAEEAAAMPPAAWDTLVPALAGWRHPAWFTLHRCWRELETHHVDLDLGRRPADWPDAYVRWALDDTLDGLRARGFAAGWVEATDLGRRWELSPGGPGVAAPGHALLGWLAGRAPAPGPDLPAPPAWPLPPYPGWS